MRQDDIDNRFTFHPGGDRAKVHEQIREECRHLASRLNIILPDTRETHLAVECLEKVMFWANAAVAREPR